MIDCMLTKNKIQRLLPEKRSGTVSKKKTCLIFQGRDELLVGLVPGGPVEALYI